MTTEGQKHSEIQSIIELYTNDQIKEAIEKSKELIATFPNEAILFNITGACYAKLNKIDLAIDNYNNAISLNPKYPEAHNNLGITFHNLGQFNNAVKCYQQALSIKPDYSDAYNNLGNTYGTNNKLNDAVECYERALEINPEFNDALHNLVIILKKINQIDFSIRSFKRILKIKPDLVDVCIHLGLSQRANNQLNDAIDSFNKAITYKPDFAQGYSYLANAYQELGSFALAIENFEKAISIEPNFESTYYNLGNVFKKIGNLSEAVSNYEKAIEINSDYYQAYNNLAVVLQDIGKTDIAIENYLKAVSIKPDYHEGYHNLALAFQDLGEFTNAIENFEIALDIKPDYAEAYHNLSYLKKYNPDDSQIKQMELLLSNDSIGLSDKVHMNFALATIYENLEDNKRLFKYLQEGNRLRKQELNYSFESSKNLIYSIKELFTPFTPIKLLSNKSSNFRPIFIVGMPRSGTTLVEQIISSHQLVYGAGELKALTEAVELILNQISVKNQKKLYETDFISIRESYIDSLKSLKISENILTDKMPLNFQYIGFILTAFPEAKIIHLKRDARAVCWSNLKCFFVNDENGFSYDIEDLVGFYKMYLDLMEFWHQLFPGQIYDISYEHLTISQEEETRKLLDYCGLEWDENCLNFHKNKRAVNTASAVQVRQKMYQGSSEAWKQYESYLEPLIKALDSF